MGAGGEQRRWRRKLELEIPTDLAGTLSSLASRAALNRIIGLYRLSIKG